MNTYAREYLDALLAGDRSGAGDIVAAAMSSGGFTARDIYLDLFQPALMEVGRLWELNKISVAEEHYFTSATQVLMSQVSAEVFAAERRGRRMVAFCAGGELHEVGLRMVTDLFEMDGWDTHFLGANMPLSGVVKSAKRFKVDLVAISVTMTYHFSQASQLIRALRAEPELEMTRILLGGRALRMAPQAWIQLGADGTASDTAAAVDEGNRLAESNEPSMEPPPPAVPEPEVRAERDADMERLSRLNNELSRMQRELAKKNADLNRVISQKNALLGMAAHDLRNPLGAIRGFIDFVMMSHKEKLPPDAQEMLGIVKDTSNYMLGMVEEMLDFAAISDGELRLEREDVDLVNLLTEAVRVNQRMADRKEIQLALELGPGCKEALAAFSLDRHKMRQVLDNLMGNAVKFSHEGTRVEVALAQAAGGFLLTVRDRGVGMEPEVQAALFRPLQRERRQGTAGEKSTGLGLSIVRRIVEGHGGRVWAESTPGQGSTFFVEIPAPGGV